MYSSIYCPLSRFRKTKSCISGYLLNYSMEQGPSWEVNRFAARQEIPHVLWNPKFHYRIHKFPPPLPILSQLDPVRILTSQFLKIHLNIILPSTHELPQWSVSPRFPHQNPVCTCPLPHTLYMPQPPHSSRFYHLQNIEWGVQNIKLIDVCGSVHRSMNHTERTNNIQPCTRIYYSNFYGMLSMFWATEFPLSLDSGRQPQKYE